VIKTSADSRQVASSPDPGPWADIVLLGKPRISTLVLVSTILGFFLGSGGNFHWNTLIALMAGTILLSWGIHALNQYMERDTDALMERTRDRPLPSGRLQPKPVLIAGLIVTPISWGVFWWGTNGITTLIAIGVAILYVAIYTPLKRRSQLNTLVGAVPGALPPVLGWAAGSGQLGVEALAMFLIMFVWQLPHFLPIAWLYRDDFRKANLAMITVDDPTGGSTRRQLILYSFTLVAVSLFPSFIGMASFIYCIGALALGAAFFVCALAMARHLSDDRARLVLRASVIYLPLLLGLLAYDVSTLHSTPIGHP